MIEIFPNICMSSLLALIIKLYALKKPGFPKLKVSLCYHPYKSHLPTTYFIIKSKYLPSEKMNFYLQNIRTQSEQANIIIIGSHIDYEALYRHHYRVFGVIDMTENKSLTFLKEQVHLYMEALYAKKR